MLNNLFTFITLILFASCIGSVEKERNIQAYEYSEEDYHDQFLYLEDIYLKINKNNITKIDGRENEYFQTIINRLVINNEFILKKDSLSARLFIVTSPDVFHFSFPGPHVYISSSLISKYIKSEKILIAILAFDIIKSMNNLYYKKILVPTDSVSTNTILKLTQLNSDYNKEISKWTYVVLKRSGNDPGAFLNWLQIKNKNPADFRTMYEDHRSLYETESSYKSFLIEKEKNTKLSDESGYNSSKGFYLLLDKIKKRII